MLKDVFKDKLSESIEGMSKRDAEYFIEHDAIPDAGSIPGLMYTDDIMEVFSDNYAEIKEVLGDVDMCDPTRMVYNAWFMMLPEVGDAVLDDMIHEEVVEDFIFDFLSQEQGVLITISDFVEEEDDGVLMVDTEIASDEDALKFELFAYIRYMCDNGDVSEMEDAAEEFALKVYEYSDEALDIIVRRKNK
jgi:hypothetical protein